VPLDFSRSNTDIRRAGPLFCLRQCVLESNEFLVGINLRACFGHFFCVMGDFSRSRMATQVYFSGPWLMGMKELSDPFYPSAFWADVPPYSP